jgi:hypothetical protein
VVFVFSSLSGVGPLVAAFSFSMLCGRQVELQPQT